VAGILGLTSLSGFAFYLAVSLLVSLVLYAKAGFSESTKYFRSNGALFAGIFGGLEVSSSPSLPFPSLLPPFLADLILFFPFLVAHTVLDVRKSQSSPLQPTISPSLSFLNIRLFYALIYIY